MPSQLDLLALCHPLIVHCKCDEIVPLDAYPPHPRNDNTHPPEQLALFEKILRHQGIRRAAVISKLTKRFVTGHGMLQTLRSMGVTGIPVDYQDFPSEEDEIRHLMADNKLPGFAGARVLEPSAGAGALAQACFRWGAARVDSVELEPSCEEQLMMLGCHVVIADFLALDPRPHFDSVVMNPPFSKGQNVKHITRALEWLSPGGSLFSIVPASDNPKLAALGAQDVKEFPAGAFKESGTSIATKLIAIDRLL